MTILLMLMGCPSSEPGKVVNDPEIDEDVGDSGGDDSGDDSGTDSGDDTGDSGDSGDSGGDTAVDSGDDTAVDTQLDTAQETGDTGSLEIDTASGGSDTGPGSDPTADQPASLPKWQRMWGGSDVPFRLDGRASFDPLGDAITYSWTATDGTFDDDTSETPWYSGGSGYVTLVVSSGTADSEPITIQIIADDVAAQIPTDYATVDDALLAGETVLVLEPGTYGPIDGAEAIIGDPEGGVVIDAAGADIGVNDASYLRHVTVTGAASHGVYASVDLRMHDVVIEGNGNSAENGGGLWTNATVIMHDTVIQGNTGNLGGGIYLERYASLYAQQDVIADNSALYGGGIYTNSTMGNVTLWNTLIVGNSASSNGGGGVFLDSRAFFTRTTVADNENGGIRLRFGYFEVDESVFAYNSVYGIQEADAPTVHISDSVFGTTDIVDGGDAPDAADGNVSGDAVFLDFTAGDAWTDQDYALDATSPGADLVTDGQDRDGSMQDVGAWGGFLGRLPAGEQGQW